MVAPEIITEAIEIPSFGFEKRKKLPSSHELQLLKQELQKYLDAKQTAKAAIQQNFGIVSGWIEQQRRTEDVKKSGDLNGSPKLKSHSVDKDSATSIADSEDLSLRASVKGDSGKVSISNGGRINIKISPPPDAQQDRLSVGPGKNLSSFPSQQKIQSLKNSRIKKRSSLVSDSPLPSNQASTPVSEDGPLDGDYSRVKVPTQQIPIASFWSFMEQYFRNITVEDLEVLGSNGDEITPFMVPPVGKHYVQQWVEEEQRIVNLYNDGVTNPSVAINREYAEVEDTVYEGDLHLGVLSERLLAAFIREGVVPDQTDDDDDPLTSASNRIPVRTRSKTDLSLMEERVRAELVHTGLITEDMESREENEITAQLLQTQELLREQIKVNSTRKKILLNIAEEYMAYQEYNTLLDDLNKQVTQAYNRRFVKSSAIKKTKKEKSFIKQPTITTLPEVVKDPVEQLLEKRKRYIEEIGRVYFPAKKFVAPDKSIYSDGMVSSPKAMQQM